ncbi:MAG: hypothetical protein FJY06_03175 [Bacteroidetes bacterium]|nr:hypothetical protein [Bacteroidota bacterium]
MRDLLNLGVLVFAAILARAQSVNQIEKRANDALAIQQYEAAKIDFQTLFSRDPKSPTYNLNFGICLFYTNERAAALNHFKLAVSLGSGLCEAEYFIGRIYHLNYDFSRAIRAYNNYLTCFPDDRRNARREIEHCNYGKQLLANPAALEVLNSTQLPLNGFLSRIEFSDLGLGGGYYTDLTLQSKMDKKHQFIPHTYVKAGNEVKIYPSYGNSPQQISLYLKRKAGDSWSASVKIPIPAGQEANVIYPYYNQESGYLYFASNGFDAMGGYDFFKVAFDPQSLYLGEIVNLGFPFSSTDDDFLFIPLDSAGNHAAFTTIRSVPVGKIELVEAKFQQSSSSLVVVQGKFQDLVNPKNTSLQITVKDLERGIEYGPFVSDSAGNYQMVLPGEGSYEFEAKISGTQQVFIDKKLLPRQEVGVVFKQNINYSMQDSKELTSFNYQLNSRANDDMLSLKSLNMASLNKSLNPKPMRYQPVEDATDVPSLSRTLSELGFEGESVEQQTNELSEILLETSGMVSEMDDQLRLLGKERADILAKEGQITTTANWLKERIRTDTNALARKVYQTYLTEIYDSLIVVKSKIATNAALIQQLERGRNEWLEKDYEKTLNEISESIQLHLLNENQDSLFSLLKVHQSTLASLVDIAQKSNQDSTVLVDLTTQQIALQEDIATIVAQIKQIKENISELELQSSTASKKEKGDIQTKVDAQKEVLEKFDRLLKIKEDENVQKSFEREFYNKRLALYPLGNFVEGLFPEVKPDFTAATTQQAEQRVFRKQLQESGNFTQEQGSSLEVLNAQLQVVQMKLEIASGNAAENLSEQYQTIESAIEAAKEQIRLVQNNRSAASNEGSLDVQSENGEEVPTDEPKDPLANTAARNEPAELVLNKEAKKDPSELAVKEDAKIEPEELSVKEEAKKEPEKLVVKEEAKKEPEELAVKEEAKKEPEERVVKEEAKKEPEERVVKEEAKMETEERVVKEEAKKEPEELSVKEEAKKEPEELAVKEEAKKEPEELVVKEEAKKEPEELSVKEEAKKEPEELVVKEEAKKEPEERVVKEEAKMEPEERVVKEEAKIEPAELAVKEEAKIEPAELAVKEEAKIEPAELAVKEEAKMEPEERVVKEEAKKEAEERVVKEEAKMETAQFSANQEPENASVEDVLAVQALVTRIQDTQEANPVYELQQQVNQVSKIVSLRNSMTEAQFSSIFKAGEMEELALSLQENQTKVNSMKEGVNLNLKSIDQLRAATNSLEAPAPRNNFEFAEREVDAREIESYSQSKNYDNYITLRKTLAQFESNKYTLLENLALTKIQYLRTTDAVSLKGLEGTLISLADSLERLADKSKEVYNRIEGMEDNEVFAKLLADGILPKGNTAAKTFGFLNGAEALAFNVTNGPKAKNNRYPILQSLPRGLVFRVQVGAFKKTVPDYFFREFSPVSGEVLKNGLTAYLAGFFEGSNQAINARNGIRKLGYNDAFVVAYCDGVRITLAQAVAYEKNGLCKVRDREELLEDVFAILKNEVPSDTSNTASPKEVFYTVQVASLGKADNGKLANVPELFYQISVGGKFKYSSGKFSELDRANQRKLELRKSGYQDAYVVAYRDGIPVSFAEAEIALNYLEEPQAVAQPENLSLEGIHIIDPQPSYVRLQKVETNLSRNRLGTYNTLRFMTVQSNSQLSSAPIEVNEISPLELIYYADFELQNQRDLKVPLIFTLDESSPVVSLIHDLALNNTTPFNVIKTENNRIQFLFYCSVEEEFQRLNGLARKLNIEL